MNAGFSKMEASCRKGSVSRVVMQVYLLKSVTLESVKKSGPCSCHTCTDVAETGSFMEFTIQIIRPLRQTSEEGRETVLNARWRREWKRYTILSSGLYTYTHLSITAFHSIHLHKHTHIHLHMRMYINIYDAYNTNNTTTKTQTTDIHQVNINR